MDKLTKELYGYGFDKVAAELAYDMDAEDVIMEGVIDGLMEKGAAAYKDENYYLTDEQIEKVALEVRSKLKAANKAVKGMMGKGKEKVTGYHKGIGKNLSAAKSGRGGRTLSPGSWLKGEKLSKGKRAKEVGKAAIKMSPHAALLAAGVTVGRQKLDKSKK